MLLQVPSERVLVVYDDLDIATAVVRLRAKGGHGGHNGMRSLCQHLGGDNFPRIRIGQASGPCLCNCQRDNRLDIVLRKGLKIVCAGVGRPPGQTTVIQHVLQVSRHQEELWQLFGGLTPFPIGREPNFMHSQC